MDNQTKLFFYKELFTNKYVCQGKAVDFEPLDGNSGVGVFIVGRDDTVIGCLQHAASQHMGGIVPISEEEYNKKKLERPFSTESERQRQEKLRIMPHRPFGPREPGVVAADMAKTLADARGISPAAAADAPPVSQLGEAQVAVAEAPGFKPATRRLAKSSV